jgi:phage gp36-like protein
MAVSKIKDFSEFGLPEQSIWDGQFESVQANIEAAESDILEALRTGGYDEPIPETSWTPGMKRRACIIAGYHFLRVRGWQAQSAEDAEYVEEYKRCIEWMDKVAKGNLGPLPRNAAGEDLDAKPDEPKRSGSIISDPKRGWGDSWP